MRRLDMGPQQTVGDILCRRRDVLQHFATTVVQQMSAFPTMPYAQAMVNNPICCTDLTYLWFVAWMLPMSSEVVDIVMATPDPASVHTIELLRAFFIQLDAIKHGFLPPHTVLHYEKTQQQTKKSLVRTKQSSSLETEMDKLQDAFLMRVQHLISTFLTQLLTPS